MRQTSAILIDRVGQTGLGRDLARRLLVPEWWDDECMADSSLTFELEVRAARLLGMPLDVVQRGEAPLQLNVEAARARATSGGVKSRTPAGQLAARVAEVVVRNLAATVPDPIEIPKDPRGLHEMIAQTGRRLTLEGLVSWLWERGVPVVHIREQPRPGLRGASTIVHGRPVVILAAAYTSHPEVAFTLAHELGHLGNGDCAEGLVEDAEKAEQGLQEELADEYALSLLAPGGFPQLDGATDHAIATAAYQARGESLDPAQIVNCWARKTGEHHRKRKILEMLPRRLGVHGDARLLLAKHAAEGLAVEDAGEDDTLVLDLVTRGTDGPPG